MEKFDVIIVGGGLAGLAAAYTLAQTGVEVLVLERGDYAGAKNITGGRLYFDPVRNLLPGWLDKAPRERFIAHEAVTLMAGQRSCTMNYDENDLDSEFHPSYSVLRGRLDKWLARETEKQGALIITKSRVDDVIITDGKVTGVRVQGDELQADVVIACDGVLSLTAQKAGLLKPGRPVDYAVGFKEIIEIDRALLEERFHLEGEEGAARLFMGEVTRGKFGGGFLYTNRESLSLGMVVGIKDLMEEKPAVPASQMLDDFKQRPEIARLIKGGNTVEYSAHVIPEGGYYALTRRFGDGILIAGDAAGLALNIGITVRGMEYALASGYYAAQAVIRARAAGSFDANTLSVYDTLLNNSFVMQDFKAFKYAARVIDNPRLFQYYPELAGNILKDLYQIPAGPKPRLYRTIKRYLPFKERLALIGDLRRMSKI